MFPFVLTGAKGRSGGFRGDRGGTLLRPYNRQPRGVMSPMTGDPRRCGGVDEAGGHSYIELLVEECPAARGGMSRKASISGLSIWGVRQTSSRPSLLWPKQSTSAFV